MFKFNILKNFEKNPKTQKLESFKFTCDVLHNKVKFHLLLHLLHKHIPLGPYKQLYVNINFKCISLIPENQKFPILIHKCVMGGQKRGSVGVTAYRKTLKSFYYTVIFQKKNKPINMIACPCVLYVLIFLKNFYCQQVCRKGQMSTLTPDR